MSDTTRRVDGGNLENSESSKERSEILADIENAVMTGESPTPYISALLLQDPSDASRKLVCEAVLRPLFYHPEKPRLFGIDKWMTTEARNILANSEALAFFESNYANKPFDPKSDVIRNENTRIATGKTKIENFGQITSCLPNADYRTLSVFITFLTSKYREGGTAIKPIILSKIDDCFCSISTPKQFFVLSNALKDVADEPFYALIEDKFISSFKRYVAVPANLLAFTDYVQLLGSVDENPLWTKLIQTINDGLAEPSSQERVWKLFLEESDFQRSLRFFGALPASTKLGISYRLLALENLLTTSGFAPKIAICLTFNSQLLPNFRACILAKAETTDRLERFSPFIRQTLEFMSYTEPHIDEFVAGIRQEVEAKMADRKGKKGKKGRGNEMEDVARGTATAAGDVVDQLKPGALKDAEVSAILKSAVAKLQPPADISRRGLSLASTKTTLQEKIVEDVLSKPDLLAAAWANPEKVVQCEKDSLLGKLGITAVRFRKTNSFDVEFIFGEEKEKDGEIPFYKIGHLDDIAELDLNETPLHDYSWLKEGFAAEILRLFYEAHQDGQSVEGCDKDSILTLLGLKDYVPPALPAIAAGSGSKASAGPSPAPLTPEQVTEQKTQEFLATNFKLAEAILKKLRETQEINSVPFKDIADAYRQLQLNVKVDRAISPQGTPVIPQSGHILAPFVESVVIHNPAQSRDILNGLNVSPDYFHQDALDAYLCCVNVKTEKINGVIYACVIPPNFDVYILGVDSTQIEDEEDEAGMALMHLVIECFHRAVKRIDDPERTSPRVPRPKRPDADDKGGAIFPDGLVDAARGRYPVLVTDFGRGGRPPEGETPSDSQAGDKKEAGIFRNRRERIRTIFEKKVYSDNLSESLASHGVFLKAQDYLRLFPDDFGIFPPTAWTNGGRGYDDLKKPYHDVYIRLETPDKAAVALDAIATQRLASTSLDLGNLFVQKLATAGSPELAFAATLKEQNTKGNLQYDPLFRNKCREVFPSAQLSSLFRTVFDAAFAGDPSVTPQDVFKAFTEMGTLNPENLFIAVSGAANHRAPYRFRNGGKDLPIAKIFRDTDYQLIPGVSPKVVSIIAGNRGRISSLSEKWLRGDERSEEQNWASEIQNQYSDRRNGNEIKLEPRARALLVWEFTDGTHAFTYLDAATDFVNPSTLKRIPSEQKLQKFSHRVSTAISMAESETVSSQHTDFSDYTRWSRSELIRLEEEGVLTLDRDKSGRILGIASSKQIKRKKIVIFKGEQVGYTQFQRVPANFVDYERFLSDLDDCAPGRAPYDPKIAKIQKLFYDTLKI